MGCQCDVDAKTSNAKIGTRGKKVGLAFSENLSRSTDGVAHFCGEHNETAGNFEVFVTYGSFVFPVPTLLFPLKSNLGDFAASTKSLYF